MTMLVGAVWIGPFVSGCDRGQGNGAAASIENSEREPERPQLTAIADAEPAPTFGKHEITGKDRRLFTMMPGRDVRKFKEHIKEKLGVIIPETSGSYVARLGRYPEHWDPPPNYELDPDRLMPDNFDSHNLAFMMPVEEVPAFVAHLRERGSAISKSDTGSAFRYVGDTPFSGESLSFHWPAGCKHLWYTIVGEDGNTQDVQWSIDLVGGKVWYKSTYGEDDD